jgi:hypothetical protein
MWSSSSKKTAERIVVIRVESGLNIAEYKGPLTDMHQDCR